jgi:hypothetical protein
LPEFNYPLPPEMTGEADHHGVFHGRAGRLGGRGGL